MSSTTLATKTFESEDQDFFARLSGDYNPMHMDPLAARRTQAGAVVVHGVHAVLWALDRLVESGAAGGGIAGLKVQFTKFIYVGSPVHLRAVRRDDKSIRAELAVGGLTVTLLSLTLGSARNTGGIRPANTRTIIATDRPVILVHLQEMKDLCGWIDAAGPLESIEDRFGHAASAIGARRVAAIALLSRLVGMVCPGLHSIFASFAIEFLDSPEDEGGIQFDVSGTDERFRMVRMNVSGSGIRGSVQAFLRWPPVAQASLGEVAKLVGPTEFTGSTALIIGGSRGLGALTAKVVASGGGKVIVTYATGRKEAEAVADEIRRQLTEDACRVVPYDARQPPDNQLQKLGVDISHLYYFATTPISRQKESLFSAVLLEEFIQLYVNGFYDCHRFLRSRAAGDFTAFYPSSVFVENGPPAMTEYSMAKAAGELLCNSLNHSDPQARVIVRRLPRLLTDQTATVPPTDSGDALEVMLPIIREVQASGAHR